MSKKDHLIVVFSKNHLTGLSIIRSLGMAGYTVDMVAVKSKKDNLNIYTSSKYLRNFTSVKYSETNLDEQSPAVSALLKYADSDVKPVLFPTDDYTSSIVEFNRDILGKYFFLPSVVDGKDGRLTDRKDKIFQSELAKQEGFAQPLKWILSSKEEPMVPEDIVYPCYCGVMEQISEEKRTICADENELKAKLVSLHQVYEEYPIMIEEMISVEKEYSLSGVCIDQKIIIPAAVEELLMSTAQHGVIVAGKLVSMEELGNVRENIVNMLKQFHYIGMFEMRLSVAKGKVYFKRIFLRSARINYVYFKSGVNLPELFVKGILGETPTEEEEQIAEYGKTFLNEKVVWDEYKRDYITRTDVDELLEKADVTLVWDSEDPVPGRLFMQPIKRANLEKGIKKIVRREIIPRLRKLKYVLLNYPQMKKKNQRNPESEKPRVLVSGRSYSSNLCMARALGQAGYEVEILRIFRVRPRRSNLLAILKPDAYSKYVKAYHVCVSHRKNIRIVRRLKALADPNRKMLLIPTDDLVANVVDEYLDELKEYYLVSNVDFIPNEINRLMNKEVQKNLAEAAGLPVINSCLIIAQNGQFEIPEGVNYPCFVKPNISTNGLKSKMQRCDSAEELSQTLTQLSRNKTVEMLVQDYVEIGKEYSILGVSTKAGVIGPGFFAAEEGGHEGRRGIALTGQIHPCSEEQKLIDDILKFIETLKFEGLFDVDLIQTVDGKMYFVELNMRFGGSGYAVTASGVNLPGMFADYMIFGKPVDAEARIENPDKRFVSEKIMLEEYANGFLNYSEVRGKMKEADIHFIKDKADMRPYRHFRKFYAVAVLMRIHRKFKTDVKDQVSAALTKCKETLLGYPQVKKKNQRNPESEKPRVLVSGRNYSSNLCMARALGQAGYEVEVLRIFRVRPRRANLLNYLKPDAYSKYVKAYYVCTSHRKNIRIVEKLKSIADPNRKMLIVPTDDVVANVLDEYYNELSQYYLLPNVDGKQDEINRLMSKEVQKELAEAAGLPVINSCVIKAENGNFEIPESVSYPCFVKPNISTNGLKSKMKKCDDEEELQQLLKGLSRRTGVEMLVQDFVEIGKEYSILGVSTKEGVIGPGFFAAEEGGHEARRGVALTGQLHPCSEEQKLIDDILKFIKTLKFEGLFDVDLIQTVDKKMYFVELNMRFGGSGYAVTASGVNLPGMFADYMFFGKSLDQNCKIENPGRAFISEKIMLEEYAGGFLKFSEVKKKMKEADIHFIKDQEDMRPYRHFRKYYLVAAMNKVYHKLK